MLRTATGVVRRFSSGNAALRGLLRRAGCFARPPASAEGVPSREAALEGEAPAALPLEGATRAPVINSCGGQDASHGYRCRWRVFKPRSGAEGEAPAALPMEGATRAPVINSCGERDASHGCRCRWRVFKRQRRAEGEAHSLRNPAGLLRDAAKPRLAGFAAGGGDGAAHGVMFRTAADVG